MKTNDVIKKLTELKNDEDFQFKFSYRTAIKSAIEQLSGSAVVRWRSKSELPSKNGEYLVYLDDKFWDKEYKTAMYKDGLWGLNLEFTHWAELNKPST